MSTRYLTDVLIIGGGYAGLLAALEARKKGVEVLILEKAYAGNSGCAKFAAGDMQCFIPGEDDLSQWVENGLNNGCFLNDPRWLSRNYPLSYEIILKLQELGLPFIKDEKGKLIRKTGRGNTKSVLIDISQSLSLLRKLCINSGIRILDRTSAIDLYVEDNTVKGVIGFAIRRNEIIFVECKCAIITSGGCSYKGPYFGMDMATGDGVAMGYRVGCFLANMEFGVKYQSTCKDFDVYGMNRFASLGGIFRNKFGERFMARYDPVLKDSSSLDILIRAMVTEVNEGRGPIFFDLTGLSKEGREVTAKLLKPLLEAMETSNVNLFDKPLEWIPAFTGTVGATSAGLWIDNNYRTSVNNLFAAGDAASKACFLGAGIGAGGAPLMFASISGFITGSQAGEKAKTLRGSKEVSCKDIERQCKSVTLPLNRKAGIDPDELTYELQKIMFRTEVNLIKEAARLKRALQGIREIKEKLNFMVAKSSHDLMKVYEVINMVTLAELTVACSLERKESRGGHYREDFPKRDDSNWLKRILIKSDKESYKIDYEYISKVD
ncbi:FAD-binding protein [Moorella sulfitireducens (nom. illeg.)]|uniref:FAD-binding protein n=1 Tax=Neomoorella sulfitireducens TaxID=2972948 RepID=UPI0030F451D5